MTLLRRYLVVLVLSFWQGGFLFYVSVVVPVGTAVLGSALRQGFITQKVTGWMNLSAAVALVILAGEMLLCREPSRWRGWARWGLWAFLLACQIVLFWLHAFLSGLMEERGRIVTDMETFYPAHRVYLWAHTVQWGGGLVFLLLTLAAWRAEDRRFLNESPPGC